LPYSFVWLDPAAAKVFELLELEDFTPACADHARRSLSLK
jgi:hypothetical protein